MSVDVAVAEAATDELLEAMNRLLPQLSSRAGALDLASLADLLGQDALTLFVARAEARIVGVLSLVVFDIPTGRRAWIEDVVVDGAARGLGAGEALTRAAVAHASERGLSEVDLTSRPSREAANSLYQKVGFERRETNVYRFFIETRSH